MKVDIGISENHRKEVSEELSKLLADSYTLYLKTHNYHWNVVGPMFHTLHTMFEEHYQELFTAIDEIAERIRALGSFAPGSHTHFKELATVKEETGFPKAQEMVHNLVKDHETVIKTAQKVLKIASEDGDDVTADLATQRMQIHEKTAWMLRATLEA